MKKYILKETQEEIKIGDVMITMVDTMYGKLPSSIEEVTEDYINNLIKENLVEELEVTNTSKKVTNKVNTLDIKFYIEHLAERINWKYANLLKYLKTLNSINETAVFFIILKEIAIVMDEKYKDHISKSKEIYVINNMNGEICMIEDLSKVNNFNNFAAFRTKEDADKAVYILKGCIQEIFSKHGK